MAQEGIATLPMQPMPEESQGIGAFQAQQPPAEGMVPISEFDRYEAIITALEQQMPGLQQKIQQILQEANLTPEQVEGLSEAIQFLEQNKDNYPAALQSLIQQGIVDEGDFPPQYDDQFMIILKMVVYAYQMQNSQPEPVPFQKGGLAQAAEALRRKGRNGDTVLAHLNPEEAKLLKRMGGSGTINPETGLPEFFVKKAVKSVGKAVGGAVKSVVGAANKVLGPQVTQLALTVGGFMIGGPAGAALGAGLGTYGSGGSFKDALISSAAAFAGAHFAPTYGWKAGALIGGAATLARGGNFKEALKSAAIGAGTTALMQGLSPSGTPAEVTDASRMGTIDASGNFVPAGSVATPSGISAVNPSGTGTSVLTPSAVSATAPSGGFGISAGPAPSIAPAGAPVSSAGVPLSANYNFTPNYSVSAPVVSAGAPASAGISSLGGASTSGGQMTLGQIGRDIAGGNFGQALSNTGTWMGQNKLMTAGLALGATGALGGFKPSEPPPPNIVDRTTGQDLIDKNPSQYLVGGLQGPSPIAPGYSSAPVASGYNPSVPTPAYGLGTPAYPIYQPFASYTPVNYNFMPRMMATGGIATNDLLQFADPNSPLMGAQNYRNGGTAQYPRRTGQISGPGTETSDDIPAMLSDGEFVITAKAVRGIGNGSRREGAKKLYRMMHAMEKKAGGSV